MNTEVTQDATTGNSTGARLRAAREQMGLTRQNVAEHLCLKLSTIRDIEDGNSPTDLALTFLRGYIRSYARLVHVPEDDLPMLVKQDAVFTAKVKPIQRFYLGKQHKKYDNWLIIFTWLVIFIVIGLTGAWWLQNYKVTIVDLISSSNQNRLGNDSILSIKPTNNGNVKNPIQTSKVRSIENDTLLTNNINNNKIVHNEAKEINVATSSTSDVKNDNSSNHAIIYLDQIQKNKLSADKNIPTLLTNDAGSGHSTNNNTLAFNFNADCWLEITDATEKKLFSGMQYKGDKLIFSGVAPYHLIIGAPSAVQIYYQGHLVDLNRFIRANQVARLTLGT